MMNNLVRRNSQVEFLDKTKMFIVKYQQRARIRWKLGVFRCRGNYKADWLVVSKTVYKHLFKMHIYR